MVTARELVVLSGFSMSHSKSVRWLSHLRGHAGHRRYTVSTVEGREIKLRKFCPSGNRTPDRRLGRRTPLPSRLLCHFTLCVFRSICFKTSLAACLCRLIKVFWSFFTTLAPHRTAIIEVQFDVQVVEHFSGFLG